MSDAERSWFAVLCLDPNAPVAARAVACRFAYGAPQPPTKQELGPLLRYADRRVRLVSLRVMPSLPGPAPEP